MLCRALCALDGNFSESQLSRILLRRFVQSYRDKATATCHAERYASSAVSDQTRVSIIIDFVSNYHVSWFTGVRVSGPDGCRQARL